MYIYTWNMEGGGGGEEGASGFLNSCTIELSTLAWVRIWRERGRYTYGGYDDDGCLGTGAVSVVYFLHEKSNLRHKRSPTPPCPTLLTYPIINNNNKGNIVSN